MGIKRSLGDYVKIQACTVCDWVRVPHSGLAPPSVEVCHKCGSDVDSVVGRFEFEQTNSFFSKRSTIVGFVKK